MSQETLFHESCALRRVFFAADGEWFCRRLARFPI